MTNTQATGESRMGDRASPTHTDAGATAVLEQPVWNVSPDAPPPALRPAFDINSRQDGVAGDGIDAGDAHPPRLPARRRRPLTRAELRLRVINMLAVAIPFIGLAAAVLLSWGYAFDFTHLIVMVVMGLISGLGITVGYHRLATHRSFKTPGFMRYLFASAGSMAVQGPVIRWAAEHRRHHQHSDTVGDPHSPHMSPDGSWGEGLWATLRGAFHAHVGWLFTRRSRGVGKYSRDLLKDPAICAASRQFPLWVVLGLVIPAVVCGLITMSWMGALLGFLWGGLVRVLLIHHITWSVNSICHLWGTRPFVSHDESRNNLLVGLLAMGEGWHNNHHAFPASARHGLRWWEFDLSYLIIRGMSLVGLASEVRVPDANRVRSRLKAARDGRD